MVFLLNISFTIGFRGLEYTGSHQEVMASECNGIVILDLGIPLQGQIGIIKVIYLHFATYCPNYLSNSVSFNTVIVLQKGLSGIFSPKNGLKWGFCFIAPSQLYSYYPLVCFIFLYCWEYGGLIYYGLLENNDIHKGLAKFVPISYKVKLW